MTKLKNSNCDKTKKNNRDKTQSMKNSNSEIKTQNLKMWQNYNFDKTKNSNCDKTQKLKMSQNFFKKCDKTWIMTNINLCNRKTLIGSFSKNVLTPLQPMRCSLGRVLWFLQCFIYPLLS